MLMTKNLFFYGVLLASLVSGGNLQARPFSECEEMCLDENGDCKILRCPSDCVHVPKVQKACGMSPPLIAVPEDEPVMTLEE